MKKRAIAWLLSLSMTVAALAGCSNNAEAPVGSNAPEENSQSEAVRDSVIMALQGDMASMNPYDQAVLLDRFVRTNWYETLLYWNGEAFEPQLAASYEISDNNLEYTFKLKEGVKFHNGEALTSEDVVYSLEKAKESASFRAETAMLEKAESVDALTVRVTLSEIYSPFLLSIASKVAIINKEYTESGGEESYNRPNGTGPYKLVSREMGARLVLEANESWHGGEVPIKHAEYVIIADPSSTVMSLESGDIDVAYMISNVSVVPLEENPDITLKRVDTQGSGYLVYNLEKAPFDDVNFRRAINYAVDRDTLIEASLDGIGTKSLAPWGPGTMGYTGNYKVPEYDMAKAKECLEKSDYNGETIKFLIGSEMYKRFAVILQESFAQLGIKTEIEMRESNSWISDMKNGNFQLSFVVHTVDADADLWSTRFATWGIGISNMSRLSREDVDGYFTMARSTTDEKERCEYYDKIMEILVDEMVIVPVFYRILTPAYNADLIIDRFEKTGYARIIDMHWK